MASAITPNTNSIPGYEASLGSNEVKENPNGVLGKDDFMKLLLVQMRHQDPTEPMDSGKILTQTSQLASLEAASNTNKKLEELSEALANSKEFSLVSAIGKMADLGSDAIAIDSKGDHAKFEIYFQKDIESGELKITDKNGDLVRTVKIDAQSGGTLKFNWDGADNSGESAKAGTYHVNVTFKGTDEKTYSTRVGAYPIESVRFENGEALARLGSSYVPFSKIYEVYE